MRRSTKTEDLSHMIDYGESARRIVSIFADGIETEFNTMLPSEWAARRSLPSALTPYPGPIGFDVCPYLREIADSFSPDSEVREAAIMKGTQLLVTTSVLENVIGYTIDVFPGPILYVTADAEMAEKNMAIKIDTLIQAAGLEDKIGAIAKRAKQRKTGDSKVSKEFAGGFLDAIGPNSAAKLRGFPYRVILADEIDAYPQTVRSEGDVIGLIQRRADAFTESRKILWASSPLLSKLSHINRLYEQGDRRKYFVPCKHCKHKQFLRWQQIKFETTDEGVLKKDSVRYECENCGKPWKNDDKDWFLPRGEWRATGESRLPGFVSYHLPAFYSPVGFRSWDHAAAQYCEIKRRGFPKIEFQNFINTYLAEPFSDISEAPRIESILVREKGYSSGKLPADAKPLFVTLAADVQKDRIEAEIVAWGKDAESWSVNYVNLYGDTEDIESNPWRELKKLIEGKHDGMRVILSGIDSGFRTSTVYSFCEQFENGVYPVQGAGTTWAGAAGYFRFFEVRGSSVVRIDFNTDLLKQKVYEYLNKSKYEDGRSPVGYCNFPKDYKRDHFLSLTAETRSLIETKTGVKKYAWTQHGKNEKLDVRVYGLGLVHALKEFVREDRGLEQLGWEDFWEIAEEFAEANMQAH